MMTMTTTSIAPDRRLNVDFLAGGVPASIRLPVPIKRIQPKRQTAVFRLDAPKARCVQLAADFTDWSKLPLNLRRRQDGMWEIKLSLSPGRYGYRFLVDGQWQDDPQCTLREPNPFGTTNAVAEVG